MKFSQIKLFPELQEISKGICCRHFFNTFPALLRKFSENYTKTLQAKFFYARVSGRMAGGMESIVNRSEAFSLSNTAVSELITPMM